MPGTSRIHPPPGEARVLRGGVERGWPARCPPAAGGAGSHAPLDSVFIEHPGGNPTPPTRGAPHGSGAVARRAHSRRRHRRRSPGARPRATPRRGGTRLSPGRATRPRPTRPLRRAGAAGAGAVRGRGRRGRAEVRGAGAAGGEAGWPWG